MRCLVLEKDQCLWPIQHSFLDNSKLLQKTEMACESLQQLHLKVQEQCRAWNVDAEMSIKLEASMFPLVCNLVLVGVFWSEEEFVEQAAHVKHPLSLDSAVPKQLLDTVRFCASESDAAVARTRVEFVKKWTRRALELEEDEKKLKCCMDALVARAVKQKRFLLFEEML